MGTVVVRGPEIPNLVARTTPNKLKVFDDRTTNFRIYEHFQPGISILLGKDHTMENYLYEEIWKSEGKLAAGADGESMEDYLIESISFTNE